MANICGDCRKIVSEGMAKQREKTVSDAASFYQIHQQQFQQVQRLHNMDRFSRAASSYPPLGRPQSSAIRHMQKKPGDQESTRAIRDSLGLTAKTARFRSRSSSSSSSTSTSRRARKKRKKRKKSSSSSSSKSSAAHVVAESSETANVAETSEVSKAKHEVLNQLQEVKKIESKDQRQKEFRALLRAWHPDKNPDKIEVATAVFQFLQTGKKLLE